MGGEGTPLTGIRWAVDTLEIRGSPLGGYLLQREKRTGVGARFRRIGNSLLLERAPVDRSPQKKNTSLFREGVLGLKARLGGTDRGRDGIREH